MAQKCAWTSNNISSKPGIVLIFPDQVSGMPFINEDLQCLQIGALILEKLQTLQAIFSEPDFS